MMVPCGSLMEIACIGVVIGLVIGLLCGGALAFDLADRSRRARRRREARRASHQPQRGFYLGTLVFDNDHLKGMF